MNTGGSTGTSPLELATLTKVEGSTEGALSNKDKLDKIKKLEELNALRVETRKHCIGTRSKNITEHISLTFGRKRSKMSLASPTLANQEVTLKLDEAIKLIPNCTGNDDIYQFINACDLAVNSVDILNVPILIRYITTKLSGKALEVIKYKDLSKWAYIRKYLEDAFESKYSASALQMQLNSVKMDFKETVSSYTDRVEKLFFKLCHIYTLGKNESESKIIQEQLREQTLALYIKGIIKPIRIMVKARNPSTLEEARSIAITEELEFNAEKETQNMFSTDRHENNINNNNRRNFIINIIDF
jgi:hypothetical protein